MVSLSSSLRQHLKATTVLTGVIAVVSSYQPAYALPSGGQVVGGNANIVAGANKLNVKQNSNRALINWKNFDIKSNEQVNFSQPSKNAIVLNRVVGGQGQSQIFGKLTANGNVVIVNPQGVLFAKGSQVNVGGLVATTADVDNNEFMNGKLNFSKAGNPKATVQNDGEIKISEGGLGALVAPNAINNGLIEAKLGKVQIASGETFSVDLYGDGLINLQASKDLSKQLAQNSGKIEANGGSVLITAAAAESTVNSLINMDGVIEATSVGKKNGKVVLTGKNVKVSGKIDVSGKNSAGEVLIGGDYQGKNKKIQNAKNTLITKDAQILANATEAGNGGRVIVWADDTTTFNGEIEAKGGAKSGNGGFVETSGKKTLNVDGSVNASAANGNSGLWLLDPRNVTISNNNTSNGNFNTSANPDTFTPTGNNSNVRVSTIQASLNGGTNVLITTGSDGSQAGNITIQDNISKTGGGNATLTLDAAGDIILNNNKSITSNNNKLNVTFTAGGAITLGNSSTIDTNGGNASLNSTGAINFNNGAGIDTDGSSSAGNVLLKSTGGNISFANNSYIDTNQFLSLNDGDITISGKALINSSGTDVFDTGLGGRWLVYTVKAADNTLDGLTGDFKRYSCTYGGACPTLSSGNGLLYTHTPLLTINITNPGSKVYGSAVPSFNYTLSGYLSGDSAADTVTGSASITTPYTQGSNKGNYDITAAAGTLASQLGYGFTGTTLTNGLVIVAKNLTASLIGSISKTYDQTTTANVNSGNFSLDGVYGTDDVVISNTSGTYDNKNAGVTKTVTVNDLALGGEKAGNYNLVTSSVFADIGEIKKRDLIVSATAQNKVYDGKTNATVTVSDDRIAGDIFDSSYTSASFDTKNAGRRKTVTVDGINITGTDADNYNFNTSATDKANITKRDLTISATGNNKVYDGNTNATVTLSDNRVEGDIFDDSYTSASFTNKKAGNGKIVVVEGLAISGTDANNYNIANPLGAALTRADIAKRDLNITAKAENKTYDGNRSATVTLSDDRVEGDIFDDTYATARFGNKNAGKGKTVTVNGISISGTDADNYNFNTSTTTKADIAKRDLTISAKAENKTYDGNRNATVSLSDDRVEGDIFDRTYENARFGTKNAGKGKTVTVSGIDISGDDASNYTFNDTAKTKANIDKRELNISAKAENKTYDGNRNATVSLSDDRVEGDTFDRTYENARFGNKNAGKGKTVTVNGIDISGDDARNYTFNDTATTKADIAKRDLNISAEGSDKVYDGSTRGTTNLSDDRVEGDDVSTSYVSAFFNDKNVGVDKLLNVYGISISGEDAKNYNFNESAKTSADITKRKLNITAKGQNKVYDGTTNAIVTLSDDRVSGDKIEKFVAIDRPREEIRDDISTDYESANFDDKNAGAGKTITVSGITISGEDAGNYSFDETVTTKADVAKRDLTVTADAKRKTYGSADPSLTFTHDELQTGDSDSIFNGGLSREEGERVANGPYAISQGDLDAGVNYNIIFEIANLTIDPATLKIKADDKAIIFGGKPSLTYTYSGLVNGDSSSVITGDLSTAKDLSLPGNYDINQGGVGAGSDYVIEYTTGTLTVVSPLSDVNSTQIQSLINEIRSRGGNTGPLLSLILNNNSGGNAGGNISGNLADLETASGGDDNGDDLNDLETASGGDNVMSLIDCTPTSFGENPCEL